MVWSPDY
ncbi:uncharacterized protein FTOL_13983 [Fusarium torulosum]|nr:uncharacterized protein FTOL_13983 [Fusarium torulosum]